MPSPVRVALIGLDHWYTAISLAQTLAAHDDVELVGIADTNSSHARQVAGQVGVGRVSESPAEFLEDESVELVASFVSTDRNPEICVTAAKNGQHILSVKPLANTLAGATEILRAVRAAGVAFLGAESRTRYSDHQQQIRGWVQDGKFGDMVTASASLWSGLPKGWPGADDPGWFADPERAPGGAWIDHSIYQIDLLRYVTGAAVTKVSGTKANLRYPDLGVEDYGLAIVEFDNGLVARIEDTWTAPAGTGRQEMSLLGSKSALTYDTLTGRASLSGALHPFDGWAHVTPKSMRADAIAELVATVRGQREPAATVEDAWQNLAACHAFYQATANGTAAAPEPLPAS